MTVYVNTANKGAVNLREKPEKNSKILAQIPYHTQLEIEYINSAWSRTVYHGKLGYIMTEFLSNEKPITKNDLQQVYNSLKNTLEIIEKILK